MSVRSQRKGSHYQPRVEFARSPRAVCQPPYMLRSSEVINRYTANAKEQGARKSRNQLGVQALIEYVL